jgi:hypothetical protein
MHVAVVVKPSFALSDGHVEVLSARGFDVKKIRAFSRSDGSGIDLLSVVLVAHLSNSIVANIFDRM